MNGDRGWTTAGTAEYKLCLSGDTHGNIIYSENGCAKIE